VGYSETRRQLVHLAMGSFAALLRLLTWWQAAALALAAFLFNLFILPRVGGPSLYRPSEAGSGCPTGILLYPLSVLLLILAFPRRPDIVAAAWGIMAVGDSAATLAGRGIRSPRLPWNGEKTVAGTAAFMVTGALAGAALAWWTAPAVSPQSSLLFVLGAPALAAVAAGFVESIPVRLDDNVSVPIVAGAVLWGASLMTLEASTAFAPHLMTMLVPAFAFNAAIAALGWRARTVSAAGATAGAVIGGVIFTTVGVAGWTMLFVSFALAAVTSRMGLKRKTVLGIAEDDSGRRGPGNAIANCGLAVIVALTAGASDTVASEIGKAWGRRTYLVPMFTAVRPGTPGAISLEGTAAGLVAALGLAVLGLALGLIHGSLLWLVVIGATAGAFVESALAATLEGPGVLNNDLLNFINTAVATLVALSLRGLIS
jgi:uncharacterized protein (TIGR00297 family)